jgi:hypothetical protein
VIAGAAMAFSSVGVVVNALRLRRFGADRGAPPSAATTAVPAAPPSEAAVTRAISARGRRVRHAGLTASGRREPRHRTGAE